MTPYNQHQSIETKRLFLRKPELHDKDELFLIRSNPLMTTYVDTLPDLKIADTLNHMNKMNFGNNQSLWYFWVIVSKDINTVIGTISLWNLDLSTRYAELGYGLSPLHRKKGLMNEAICSVLDFAFNSLKFQTIEAYTEHDNKDSVSLLQKIGFEHTDNLTEEGYYHAKTFHFEIYKLTKMTWLSQKNYKRSQ